MGTAQTFKKISVIVSFCIFMGGSAGLIGWIFDIPALKSIYPDFVTMKANTAICFLLIGVSLFLLQAKWRGNKIAFRVASLCAFVVFLVGFLTLLEYVFGWNFNIDQLLFKESATAILTSSPGRMAFNTSIIFLIMGIVLLLYGFEVSVFFYVAHFLLIPASIVALLSFTGYLYGATPLYLGLKFSTAMAAHTSILFIISCIGCLFVRPEHGLMKNVSSDNYGGVVLRRIVPIVIVIPLALGWFKIYAEKIFLFSNEFGVSLVAIGNLVVTSLFVYVLSISLNRFDAKRKKMEEQIKDNQDCLRSLASRSLFKEERERKQIAEGIHDSIIQPLIFLDIKIKSHLMKTTDNEKIESFGQIRTILVELIDKSRTVIFDLSDPILYELGLEAGIEEWLQTEIRDKHGMTVKFQANTETKDLDQNLITFLFKSAKELLINVVKHSKATNVSVSLAREHNNVMLCVEDNGCGFDHDSQRTKQGNKMPGFGLFNIHEQLVYLGGNFSVQSNSGVGSKIVLMVPFESKV